jgi:AcrR family transcriptional regulator
VPKLTPERAEARRKQIIDGAVACFARNGFHKTTMQDIVRACGLSPGAIYCHFNGKHDIVLAAVAERHGRERDLVRRASDEPDWARSLERIAADFLEPLTTRDERLWRELTIQLWAESLRDRRIRKLARDGVDAPRALLAATMREAKHRGELPAGLDVDAAARLLIAMFQGLVLQLAWDDTVDVAACATAAKALLLNRRVG